MYWITKHQVQQPSGLLLFGTDWTTEKIKILIWMFLPAVVMAGIDLRWFQLHSKKYQQNWSTKTGILIIGFYLLAFIQWKWFFPVQNPNFSVSCPVWKKRRQLCSWIWMGSWPLSQSNREVKCEILPATVTFLRYISNVEICMQYTKRIS